MELIEFQPKAKKKKKPTLKSLVKPVGCLKYWEVKVLLLLVLHLI